MCQHGLTICTVIPCRGCGIPAVVVLLQAEVREMFELAKFRSSAEATVCWTCQALGLQVDPIYVVPAESTKTTQLTFK